MRYYVIVVSAAHMPAKCWGRYQRVGVLEVVSPDHGERIDDRAEGVIRVVRTWERCSVGSTARCAADRAYAEAQALVAELRREALVEQALAYGGVVDGDVLVVETLDGSECVTLADLLAARAAVQADAAAAAADLSQALADAADAAAGLALAGVAA